jgi:hypothetical protein
MEYIWGKFECLNPKYFKKKTLMGRFFLLIAVIGYEF